MKVKLMINIAAASVLMLGVQSVLAGPACSSCSANLRAESGAAKGEKAELKPQATCPVMGGAINKKQYVDHEGKRIYVCCPGCIRQIKADPDKYINKLESEGVKLERIKDGKVVKE